MQDIDRGQWDREGIWIDVMSSDFLEGPPHQLTPRWTGVSIFHVKPRMYDVRPLPTLRHHQAEPSATPLTAKQASIEAAISSLWPAGIPDHMSVKERDRQIMQWQKKNGAAVATSRTISRYMDKKSRD
jgi:hypothetical protein